MSDKIALTNKAARSLNRFVQDVQKINKPLRIRASEVSENLPDEATQQAQAYWMLGWTWEEIDAILVDMGYSSAEVSKAVKETQEYAKKALEKGPFSMFRYGQYVKLKNGKIGSITFIGEDSISIQFTHDGEKVNVSQGQIDMEATLQLTKAKAFRDSANRVMRLSQKKEYVVPEDLPGPVQTTEGETPEKYKVLSPKDERTPSGWADITPESGEVEALNKQLATMVNNIEGLRAMKDELQTQLKEVKKQLSPIADKIRTLNEEEQLELRNIFVVANEMENGLNEMGDTIFGEYEGKLVGLQQKMIEQVVPVGMVDEYNALVKILEDNHPRVAKGVLAALEEWKESNSPIRQMVEKVLAKYKFRRVKKKSTRVEAQAITKLKEVFQSAWEKIKNVGAKLYETVFPVAKESVAAIEQFESKLSKQSKEQNMQEAVSMLLR